MANKETKSANSNPQSSNEIKAFSVNLFDEEHNEMTINPSWVVTFVRWSNRSPKNIQGISALKNEEAIVVSSDCLGITVNNSKSSPTPAAQINLKMGNYNYLSAIAPGDYVFINLLDSELEAERVARNAKSGYPINTTVDGFKGFFKVQSVRKIINTDHGTGLKTVMCVVQAYAFTELNNTVYFNAKLATEKTDMLFLTEVSEKWNQLVQKKSNPSVQNLVALIFSMFVGVGAPDKKYAKALKDGTLKNYNEHFFVPSAVGKLLGTTYNNNGIKVQDIYNLLFGIQRYESSEGVGDGRGVSATGLNPAGLKQSPLMPRLLVTKNECEGNSYIQAEYWQQVTAFSLMQQYLNAPINELYNTFRVDPTGKVMPTIVMRQIPFASPKYSDNKATKFLNLPRWVATSDFIYQMNVGREEAARVNFVQGFGRVQLATHPDDEITKQIGEGNYEFDKDDIKKHGLRVQMFNSPFDVITEAGKETYLSRKWTRLMADALIGGHLKLNGSVTTPGVAKPVCVGDNMQIGDVVYHIEGLTHSCSINPSNGEKQFQTTFELSHGVLDKKDQYYAEMENTITSQHQLFDFDGKSGEPKISFESNGAIDDKNISFYPKTKAPATTSGGGYDGGNNA
jgi:hypothetical protein